MQQKIRAIARQLLLFVPTEQTVELPAQQEKELIRALAELLHEAARSMEQTAPQAGGANHEQ
jgi:hypothetical protein